VEEQQQLQLIDESLPASAADAAVIRSISITAGENAGRLPASYV